MRWLLPYLVCLVALGQTTLQNVVREGHTLTAEQAASLEKELEANPFTVEKRARLIGHYFKQVQQLRQDTPAAVREARGRHIRWFIEYEPASEVLSTSEAFAMSGWMHDPLNYQVIRDMWMAEVKRSPDKLHILKNAAYLLQQHDRPLAAQCMRRAYEITSRNDLSVTGRQRSGPGVPQR